MPLHPLKYKISSRWIKTDKYDQYGREILLVNPNPDVTILQGVWRQGEGELIKGTVSAKEFHHLTGITVLGGDFEKRGIIKTHVEDRIHQRIQKLWIEGEMTSESLVKKKKKRGRKKSGSERLSQDNPMNKIHEQRLERAKRGTPQKKGVPIRVRKKK